MEEQSATEFRAVIVVGSGSKSFEMIRYLTLAIEKPVTKGEIIEIGGSDVLTYAEMMQIYAELNDDTESITSGLAIMVICASTAVFSLV